MNRMMEIRTDRGAVRLVFKEHKTDSCIGLVKDLEAVDGEKIDYEIFDSGDMPLEKLPEDVQLKVRNVLKCYDRCSVVYEYREFNVNVGTAIKSHYNHDHFVCGYYHAADVYTEEERRQNYIEAFGGR